MAVVFLDLWGVACNHDEMDKGYRLVMSEILQREYGGDRRVWLRAHDAAYMWYVEQVTEAETRQGSFRAFVDRIDAEHIRRIFETSGVPFPAVEPLPFARELESRVVSRVASAYPDVRSAVARLRDAGHTVYVATQGTESMAEGAIQGAGLAECFAGLLTGDNLDAFKSDSRYWTRALARVGVEAADCAAVDDSLRYLEAASSVGVTALLLDRLGAHPADSVPTFVRAVLRHLAGLPQFVESAQRARPP